MIDLDSLGFVPSVRASLFALDDDGLVPARVAAVSTDRVDLLGPDAPAVRAVRQAPSMPSLDLGNIGLLEAEFETRLLPGNVLYVRFSPCFTPLQQRFEAALEQAVDPAGVVLDLRDNPGGLGAVAMGMARHFLQGELALGSMHMRDQEEPLRFLVNPVDAPYRGPVIVLVNGGTGSTAEILAAAGPLLERRPPKVVAD